jgi:hypothetical protein
MHVFARAFIVDSSISYSVYTMQPHKDHQAKRKTKLKYKYLCIYVGGSNPLFLALACISRSVDIKLSAHDAPPEQSALGTLKIERLDRQATQKFLESNTTKRTAMVTRARGIITQIKEM